MTTKVNSDLLERETRHAAQSERTAVFRYQKKKYDERKEAAARTTEPALMPSALAMAKDKIDLLRSITDDECMPEEVRSDARKKIVKLMEDLSE